MTKRYVSLAAGLCLLGGPVCAQSVDAAGVRARGMAGAFTAVADDASATWWNPAGLAAGPFFNAVVEFDRTEDPRELAAGPSPVPSRVAGLAVGIPPLGVSYYHFRISEIQAARATEGAGPSRQDLGPVGAGVLVGDQFGATVGQSVGDHFVAATTLKLVHGGPDGGEATTSATLDLGAMATFGLARVGVAARNLTEPALGSGRTLARQIRAGGAVMLGGRGPADAITIAADADLATRHLLGGDRRGVSAGAEVWFAARRVGVRGGVAGETVGDFRPSGSAGASVAIRSGMYVDAGGTAGGDAARHGWSVGLRVTF